MKPARNFAAVRAFKLRSWHDAASVTRHGRRCGDNLDHVDQSRSWLNIHFTVATTGKVVPCSDGIDVGMEIRERAVQAGVTKWAKDAPVGTELLWIFSKDQMLDEVGNVDIVKAAAIMETALQATLAKFPGMVVGGRADFDETTPHISFFICPIYEKTYSGQKRAGRRPRPAVSHNKIFDGGRDGMRMLQDWAASSLQAGGWNFVRGKPKTTSLPDYIKPEEGRRQMRLAEAERQKANAQAADAAARGYEAGLKLIQDKMRPQLTKLATDVQTASSVLADLKRQRTSAQRLLAAVLAWLRPIQAFMREAEAESNLVGKAKRIVWDGAALVGELRNINASVSEAEQRVLNVVKGSEGAKPASFDRSRLRSLKKSPKPTRPGL